MNRVQIDMLRGFLYLQQALTEPIKEPTRECSSCEKELPLSCFCGECPCCNFCDELEADAERMEMDEEPRKEEEEDGAY